MTYTDPSAAGTPQSGQPVSSQWGRDVQTDVEVEEASLLTMLPLAVNQSVDLSILAAPTSAVGTWAVSGGLTPSISNTTAALNDSATWTTSLVAGTYDIRIIGTSAASQGQVQFYLDGATIGSVLDEFSASTLLITGVSVAAQGTHTIKATVTGKNASSSGYAVVLAKVILTRRS